jgi:hypothetical protein
VVGAEYLMAALQGVLAEGAGRLGLAHTGQGERESAGGGQGVGMVGAEEGPPAVEQLFCGSPEIVEGSLCRVSGERGGLVVDR